MMPRPSCCDQEENRGSPYADVGTQQMLFRIPMKLRYIGIHRGCDEAAIWPIQDTPWLMLDGQYSS